MSTLSPRTKRRLSFGLISATLLLLLVKWRQYATRDSVPPLPISAISPMSASGHRDWSRSVVHYPGFNPGESNREWSHWEIAQRHRELVNKDLPDYITELRGFGAKKESSVTDAGWFFVVPENHIEEFRRYLIDLGVPERALHNRQVIQPPPEYRNIGHRPPPPSPPTEALIFVQSNVSDGEGSVFGMRFGKSSDTVCYTLINPNNTRASAQIEIGWISGNVRVYELPTDPAARDR